MLVWYISYCYSLGYRNNWNLFLGPIKFDLYFLKIDLLVWEEISPDVVEYIGCICYDLTCCILT